MYLDEAESSVPGKVWSGGASKNLEDTLKSPGFKWDEEDKDSEGDESDYSNENDNNKIDNEDLKRRVYYYMAANAEDTFLWVALVCQRLTESNVYKHRVLEELEQIPKGLHDLYKLMMDRILTSSESNRLKAVLTTACLAHRPLKSKEMAVLVESMERYDEKAIRKTVRSCGSFLAYQDRVIYFVLQSAKEYLLDKRAKEIIPHGLEHHHLQISWRCLDVLKSKRGLKENIYGLAFPGAAARESYRPKPDPLALVEYLCLHWTKHLIGSGFAKSQDAETLNKVLQFFQAKFTSWLEALSLLGHLSVAVRSIANIGSALENSAAAELIDFLWDARRFVRYHAQVIASAPLQVYSSVLIFSPRSSKVREKFEWQVPSWIISKPEMPEHWDACVQTLHVHKRSVRPLTFSPDGKFLAVSREKQVQIIDVALGTSSYHLNFDESLASAAFSSCGTKLACIQTLKDVDIYAVAFSPDGEQLATISSDEAHVWNWRTGGNPVNVLQGHGSYATSVAFLPKGKLITGSDDGTAKIWNLVTNSCEQTLEHDASVWSVACSANGRRLATGSKDKTAQIWYEEEGTGKWVCGQTLQHKQEVPTVCFSPDGRILISGSLDNGLRLWDEEGVCIKILYGHTKRTTSLSVPSTGKFLASGFADGTVKLWDIFTVLSPDPPPAEEECSSSLGDYVSRITSLSFSPDGQILISHSEEGETKLWNIGETCCTLAQEVPDSYQPFFENPTIASVWPSHISLDEVAAMRDREGETAIWNMTTKKLIHRLDDKNARVESSVPEDSTVPADAVDIPDPNRNTARPQRHYKFGERLLVFSPDHEFLATSSDGGNIRVWDISSGECLLIIQNCHFNKPLAFSRDSRPPFPKLDSSQTGTSKSSLRLTTQLGVLESAVPDRFEDVKLVGLGISLKGDWICRGADLMLWIPPQYRKLVVDAVRNRFAIICPSGRIVMLQVA
ncbi:NACHT domain-containing protein [Fusarium sp. LHS14.1]|nr:NACHT domain-containing protein [Fusarium sp. LHS14.1]